MRADLDKTTVEKAYARWAPVYDLVFGAVFENGRNKAIAAAERVGGHVLDVGIGTGVCLGDYKRTTRITGVDLSEPMLRKAQERVDELGLTNVECLAVMDAENLSFPDESFDVVVAMHVVSTVPHPIQCLNEFARVLKPGGEIVLISRVGADKGPRKTFEKWFMPISRQLGWRSDFPFSIYTGWAKRTPGIRLLERKPVPPLGHFSLVRFGKDALDKKPAPRRKKAVRAKSRTKTRTAKPQARKASRRKRA
jgi:phosphatidylethanolamine/phosphatidyl-N-methylethanolamine N-methyltransferase